MDAKRCFKCGEEKPKNEFYRHSRMSDGLLGKCKECAKKDVRENRRTKISQYAEFEKRRNKTAERKAAKLAYQKRRACEKKIASTRFWYAIRTGKIIRQPCEVCGNKKTEGHHDDYSKPLDVRWLCFKHHREAHGQIVVSQQ